MITMKWTDLNLSNIKYFVDAIRLHSLTQSAVINHVSRPAVSQAIRRLEHHLGYSIITHKKRELELTKQGKTFFEKASIALEQLSSTLDEVSAANKSFKIACSATIAEHLIIPWLKKINLINFGRFEMKIGTSAKVRQLVEDGECTVGLLIDDRKTYGFESVVLSKGNFEFLSKNGRLSHLLITTENRPEVIEGLKFIGKKNKAKDIIHVQVESWSLSKKMAEAVSGTCLVPDIIPRKPLKKVLGIEFKFPYEVLAIGKNRNLLLDFVNSYRESTKA